MHIMTSMTILFLMAVISGMVSAWAVRCELNKKIDNQQRQIDDLKRELEEMKRKE